VTYILAKAGAPADDYQFTYDPGSAGFQFSLGGAAVSSDIAIQGSLTANGVWVHLVGWYDSGDGQVYLRINDTTTVASTTSPAPSQHASLFFIGGGNTLFSDSTIDEVGFWKRKLNSEEITALNNSGNALAYGSFTV
jgi:hypothetical protein